MSSPPLPPAESPPPPPPDDLSQLPDLRTLLDDLGQDASLTYEAPTTPGRRDRGAARDYQREVAGPHMAIMVLRYLYRFLPPRDRLAATNPDRARGAAIAEEEERHRLLRIAWTRLGADKEDKKALSSALEGVLLRGAKEARRENLTLLLESPAMHETLFAREPFLLRHPVVLTQPAVGLPEGQAALDHWVATGEDVPRHVRAEQSLLDWSAARDGPLDAFVESQFGVFVDDTRAVRTWVQFACPLFLRVHSQVLPGSFRTALDRRRVHCHAALSELHVAGHHYAARPAADGRHLRVEPLPDVPKTQYVLIMVVRLGDDQLGGELRLRRYHLDGRQLDEPARFEQTGYKWRLDDAQGEYYLYYCRRPEPPGQLRAREPEAIKPWNSDAEDRRRHMELFRAFNPDFQGE